MTRVREQDQRPAEARACDRHDARFVDGCGYVCRNCDLRICTDCGTSPAHDDSPPDYCRRCSEKAGHRYAFQTAVDHDLLRAKVGHALAAEILNTCRGDGHVS